MGATQGKLERVHTCVENYLQRRRRRDALDAVDAVDASRWFRPAQVETRLGRYLEDKHIWYYTSTYGIRRVKHYKVIEYDLDTKKYTVFNQDVEGPIEYIEILDEKNIEVFVEVIPMESSDDEDDDDEEFVAKVEELVAEFAAKSGRKDTRKALRAICTEHELWSEDLVQRTATVPELKEALVRFLKTGEKGAKTDYQQKVEESSNALDAFLLLPVVMAITSTISNFNPKNPRHAARFLEQYHKKHGKGPTRSGK